MFPCNVTQLIRIVSGQTTAPSADEPVTGVSIDSRTVKPGDAFFALPGSKSHGVLYADDAIARGAVCVIAESTTAEQNQSRSPMVRFHSTDSVEVDSRIIRVPSALTALQQLAHWNRKQSAALVIGVTGSVGKTTTRQMIASVLNREFHGIQSPRNFNNELGVPLSLLQLKADHDFVALEMGAGRIGDIRKLTEIALPEFGVITRVAPAHVESFGSLDLIRQAKQELAEAIRPEGTVFLNADDPAVRQMADSVQGNVVLYGFSSEAHVRATNIVTNTNRSVITVDGREFQFQGARHLATSALAAIAVGRTTGMADSRIADGLSGFQLDAGRGRMVNREPWTVIDDSYNASPASVIGAIQGLADWPNSKHRILVLGDMLELGQDSAAAHFEIGRQLASSNVDHTLVYGQFAESVVEGARSTGVTLNHISLFHDLATLQVMLDCIMTPGDVVLIKGSRGMQMENVVQWLQQQAATLSTRAAA
jgi:UDP-N-acetylmuramoyl-tripeptide--D-alanyl-D-alanine ligase